MPDERIPGLGEQTALNYADKAILDRTGLSDAKSITFDNALRTEVAVSEDATGVGTFVLNYVLKDRISATIDQDCEFSFSNVPIGSTNYLRVVKGSANLVTFTGVTGTVDSKQVGETSITYRIERKGSSFYVSRVDNQFEDSLVIGDLTPVTPGTVTNFSYFNSVINNDMCSFEGVFNYTPDALVSLISIGISNWDVSKVNPNYTSMSMMCSINITSLNVLEARVKDDSMIIVLDTAVDEDILMTLNGSFRIK